MLKFTWDSGQYAGNSTAQALRAFTALDSSPPQAGEDVLDIGCGDGKITREIAKVVNTGNVLGFDKDESMVQGASSYSDNPTNLEIKQADAVNFSFNKRFDLVTSFFCIQWVVEDELISVFNNINKHLKADGRALILLAAYDFPHEVIKSVAFSEKWNIHFNTYQEPQVLKNAAYYEAKLKETSFQKFTVEEMTSQHEMTDDSFVDYTEQWCGCYRFLPNKDLRAAFIDDVKNKLRETEHKPDGSFDMQHVSIKILAHKNPMFLFSKKTTGPQGSKEELCSPQHKTCG